MSGPDFLSTEYLRDPYAMQRVMRDEYPLYFHAPTNSYVMSRYEDVARAFRDPAFSNQVYVWQLKDVYPDRTIIQMDGKEHAAYRNIVAPSLRETELRAHWLRTIEDNARSLIDVFRNRGEVDLVGEFTSCYPINVTVDLLGLPQSDRGRFQRWYQALVDQITNLQQDPAIVERGRLARRQLCEYLIPVLDERRAAVRNDLLSAMVTAEVGGRPLSDTEIQAFVALLLVGGGETLDNGLGLLFKNLVQRPEVLAAVRSNRSLCVAAFAETLRFTPPVHMVMRMTVEDVEVSGGTIPKNSFVVCMIAAANRDERRWRDPDTFDIQRRDNDLDVSRSFTAAAAHLAFGSGRHFCAGAALAKIEVEVAVNQLLDAMCDVRFTGDVPPDRNYFIRGPRTLPLHFTVT